MAALKGFLGVVWSYGVSLPLFMLRHIAVGSLKGVCEFFWPRGYKPCNHLLEPLLEACANRPAGELVRLPWVNSSATETVLLNNTGRLLAYVAIAKGWFGVAVKETGSGSSIKRHYRYYYRRSMTGNWFAEIWSVPKSGLIAGALAVPLLYPAAAAFEGRPAPYAGLLLLLAGLALVVCFLPRAILGRSTHYVSMAPINGGLYGGYGCAQVINWVAGLGGISFLWLAMGAEWNVGAVFGLVVGEVRGFIAGFSAVIEREGWYRIFEIPLFLPVGALVAIASMAIPCGLLWYMSLRFLAARKAKAELESLPFNATQQAMYIGSDFQVAAETFMPQIALGFLVYLAALFGFVLHPMVAWLFSLF